MSGSMGLPVQAGGRPNAAVSGNMGLPVGMSIGTDAGSYGQVSSTHPGNTFQSQINPRSQSSFNVQPQVTVAVRAARPLPEGARRKDFLMSINTGYYNTNNKSRTKNKSFYPGGVVMTTLSEINAELRNASKGRLKDYIGDIEENMTPKKVANVIRPLGVYHNRATHDAHEAFTSIYNSNVSDILSISKSNHCFVRDIWGSDLYPGDKLGFVYCMNDNKVEIVPFVGDWEFESPSGSNAYVTTNGHAYINKLAKIFSTANNLEFFLGAHYIPIGRVWAPAMHRPFNSQSAVNIVDGDDDNNSHVKDKYHNIEVELTPCMADFAF